MADVIIFGIGQMAEVAEFYIDLIGEHKVVAFVVNEDFKTIDTKNGLPVVSWESLETNYPPSEYSLFCPISYKSVNLIRKTIFLNGLSRGYDFISVVHPNAHYYGTEIGRNCFIMEANVIQPFTKIGDNCILWSGNHIGHHSTIQSHCFIASHVVVSGGVNVGERTFIGVNATIRDNISVGQECVIGASTTVLKSLDDKSVVVAENSAVSRVPSNRLKRI